MKILIQKFGGTSVSTKETRAMVIAKIEEAISKCYNPVVVVSAMGRKGEPYATDSLLSLLNEEFKNENLRAVDLLMSCGETISTTILCSDLKKSSIETVPLTGGQAGIVTDSDFGNATVLNVDIDNLLEILQLGKIPVVAGFQGQDSRGNITTLGRGGSDVTASILGAALNACAIEIYTDVDGIMTADPRIVKEAYLIDEISYNEVFQFAEQGAKVIHKSAVDIAMKANIPLIIRNTLSNSKGTLISNDVEYENENILTGITHVSGRVQIKVLREENANNENFDILFELLAEAMISIDLINIFPDIKVFTIDERSFNSLKELMEKHKICYSCTEDCSKISLIGSNMHGIPGVMARILKVLGRENIRVLQTADSYMTIWCLIENKYSEKAILALHKEFYPTC